MSNLPHDLDKWKRPDRWNYIYKHTETGKVIHEETYEAKKKENKVIEGADVTPNGDLRALIEEWRDRGVVDPYGMTWMQPADELEALLNE